MERSNRGERLRFLPSRRAAMERRFCTVWPNRTVNEMEKRFAELSSELVLIEEAVAELEEKLRELQAGVAGERSLPYIGQQQRVPSRWRRQMKKGCMEKLDETDEENSERTPTTCDPRESDGDTSDVANDADTSSQPAQCDANPGFTTKYLTCEEDRVQVDRAKQEALLAMQWKEWMDKQEMRQSPSKVDQQKSEEQGGATSSVPQEQMEQKVKVGNFQKMKTYFYNMFKPNASYKWERFEDED